LLDYSGFHNSVDPEELFRNIFGKDGFKMSGFAHFDDFADSDYGFAGANGVSTQNLVENITIFWSTPLLV
jgi:hypothetical protein